MTERFIRWFEELGSSDVALVGGKNASLGEMVRNLKSQGINVPDGFATTVHAYWRFLDENDLRRPIASLVDALHAGTRTLQETGSSIRELILEGEMPSPVADAVTAAYRELARRYGRPQVDVAARSSATAEDLPGASFAGQQESFLNVVGEKALLDATRRCFASLFTDRAISYRENMGFDHMKVGLSVGVQKMVRSDKAGAGVLFTIDTETGFPNTVVINASWGLGEIVVQGRVVPDEYVVFKPALADAALMPIIEREIADKRQKIIYARGGGRTIRTVRTSASERRAAVLTEDEVLRLARWGVAIEDHYGVPMDVEWAKDGETGELSIVQARPETVQSRREAGALKTYTIKQRPQPLLSGVAIGDAIAAGPVSVIEDIRGIAGFKPGSVLVTSTTNPDWVPIMKKAAAIVTDHGGRTSHAAIVSRELGLPAIVGAGKATTTLEHSQNVTVSCAEGEVGYVYEGKVEFEEQDLDLEHVSRTRTGVMMNVASPAAALRWWRLPCRGIGLARMEFIISGSIKVHPMALVNFAILKDNRARKQIERLTAGYDDPTEYFVDRLSLGIARIAASQHPHPVIVRMSDFKTNEYASLIGGAEFEPQEENPMIGFRGASRYYSDAYRDGFALECRAVVKARSEIGMKNIVVMIPFCRTIEEAERVLAVMEANGLSRGDDGLEIYVMAEIPSNVILADQFSRYFDGFSIGSNDLTQLALGVDRDSERLAYLFDERNEAVVRLIRDLVERAHKAGCKVGICGQAPSDHPDFAAWLVEIGIDSISVNPDSALAVLQAVAQAERDLGKGRNVRR
jgi:pyruvate,water dikinase